MYATSRVRTNHVYKSLACDKQTDRQTDRQWAIANTASTQCRAVKAEV